MNAALGLQALLAQQPAANAAQIQAAIAAHPFTPNPVANQLAVILAQQMAAELFKLPDPSGKKFPAPLAVRWSVLCNDRGSAADAQPPGGVPTDGTLADQACAYWPRSGIQRPPWAMAGQAGPILMLQSRYDALTPMEGAQVTLDALPNASMIVVENEFRHGVFPYGEPCVDAQVAQYFLHATMPPRLSSCAGRPLPFDAGNAGATR